MGKPKATIETPTLRPEVAEVYEIAPGVLHHFVDGELGEIDLTKIGLEFADRVAIRGFLVKKVS